jgi:hypothetical protein
MVTGGANATHERSPIVKFAEGPVNVWFYLFVRSYPLFSEGRTTRRGIHTRCSTRRAQEASSLGTSRFTLQAPGSGPAPARPPSLLGQITHSGHVTVPPRSEHVAAAPPARRTVTPGTGVTVEAGFSRECGHPGRGEQAFHPYSRVEVQFVTILTSLTGEKRKRSDTCYGRGDHRSRPTAQGAQQFGHSGICTDITAGVHRRGSGATGQVAGGRGGLGGRGAGRGAGGGG